MRSDREPNSKRYEAMGCLAEAKLIKNDKKGATKHIQLHGGELRHGAFIKEMGEMQQLFGQNVALSKCV